VLPALVAAPIVESLTFVYLAMSSDTNCPLSQTERRDSASSHKTVLRAP
jgi:hypothetical protein